MQHLQRLETIFRQVLDDATLVLTEDFSREACTEWDSVATVHIILAVEAEFKCSLPMELIADCSRVDQILAYIPDGG
jgi:acyl carrier protein